MSSVQVSGNASGTGTLTIAAPNTNSNYTISLPTVTGGSFIASDSSGNVGIGGSPFSYGAGYTNLWVQASVSTTRTGTFYATSSAVTFGSIAAVPLITYTANVERMRIDSSGNLLVGTTSQKTYSSRVLSQNTGAGVFSYYSYSGTGAGASHIGFETANGFCGQITTTGTTTSYGTSSDYRLKTNVQPMTGALTTVAQLKPCTYTWKSDNSAGQGFIAHELQAVLSECVTGQKDAVDKNGNPIYQTVDTSFLVATLTAAIQEQQAIITQLQADVAALKGAK
jgi:hypothetical protein